MGKTVKQSILEGMANALPHNVQGTPIPRTMMPQLKKDNLKHPDTKEPYITTENPQFPVSQIIPVQTERVPGLVKKVYDNFYGKDKPFILDKDYKLVNGHHRYDAARLLGRDVVDAIIVKDKTVDELIRLHPNTRSNTPTVQMNDVEVEDEEITEFKKKVKLALEKKQRLDAEGGGGGGGGGAGGGGINITLIPI